MKNHYGIIMLQCTTIYIGGKISQEPTKLDIKIIIVVDWMSPFMLILVIIKVAIIVLPLWVTVLYLTYCSEGDFPVH